MRTKISPLALQLNFFFSLSFKLPPLCSSLPVEVGPCAGGASGVGTGPGVLVGLLEVRSFTLSLTDLNSFFIFFRPFFRPDPCFSSWGCGWGTASCSIIKFLIEVFAIGGTMSAKIVWTCQRRFADELVWQHRPLML